MDLLRTIGHFRWIHPELRERLLWRFSHPHHQPNREFCADFYGLKYHGNLNSYIDWCVWYFGAYEEYTLLLLRDLSQLLEPVACTFFDVGANVGNHSLFMSQHASQVHSFEVYERVRQRLIEKITDNQIGNIQVHGFALGAADQAGTFYAPEDSNLGNGSLLSQAHDSSTAMACEIRRGDELALGKCGILKIDVEGYEGQVLAGFGKTLHRDRPFLVMELSGETKRQIGSEAELRRLLYPDCCIVELVPGWKGYRLKPFDFGKTVKNILVYPAELAGRIQRFCKT